MIAGSGLTGGGTLASDRTFNVGAGSYINVNANDIDVDATTTATASKVVARDGAGNVYATYFNGIATPRPYYADLAEIYVADADYERGTVVKLGGEKEITQTNNLADIDVFRVISINQHI